MQFLFSSEAFSTFFLFLLLIQGHLSAVLCAYVRNISKHACSIIVVIEESGSYVLIDGTVLSGFKFGIENLFSVHINR